jgi:hypothetical protein
MRKEDRALHTALRTFSGTFKAQLSPELYAAVVEETGFVKHKTGKRQRASVPIPPLQTLLDSFFRLLKLYEGVVVIDEGQRNTDRGLFVCLQISDPRSIVRLLHCATGANIRSDVYERGLPKDSASTEETLESLVWTLIFDRPFMQEDLDIYCIFMVWDLGARGVLSESDYESLLSLLGGAKKTWGDRKSTTKEAQ